MYKTFLLVFLHTLQLCMIESLSPLGVTVNSPLFKSSRTSIIIHSRLTAHLRLMTTAFSPRAKGETGLLTSGPPCLSMKTDPEHEIESRVFISHQRKPGYLWFSCSAHVQIIPQFIQELNKNLNSLMSKLISQDQNPLCPQSEVSVRVSVWAVAQEPCEPLCHLSWVCTEKLVCLDAEAGSWAAEPVWLVVSSLVGRQRSALIYR